MPKRRITLGEDVVDKITGFKGKVVADANYIFGCRQLWVQPPVDEKGSWVKPQWIDEPSLKLIKKPKSKPKKRVSNEFKYGGDRSHPED